MVYISVTLKGRVALDMGTHELLITELVYRNILTNLQPAEIAALLSALVFQQKMDNDPEPKLAVLKEVIILFIHLIDNLLASSFHINDSLLTSSKIMIFFLLKNFLVVKKMNIIYF